MLNSQLSGQPKSNIYYILMTSTLTYCPNSSGVVQDPLNQTTVV